MGLPCRDRRATLAPMRFMARFVLVAVGLFGAPSRGHTADLDVVVYGGTPGGIAAALAAARQGHRVALVEPTRHIGGMVTSGLSHADFHAFEGITGTYRELVRRVERYYREKYGADSPQAKDCFRGTHAEPHVNELIFEQMLAEQAALQVHKGLALVSVKTVPARAGKKRIRQAAFAVKGGERLELGAKLFIDGTYEGDLMAMAGAKYRVGREGRGEYGESLAPDESDGQVQAYNFRLIMTTKAENRVLPVAPPGYRREIFVDLLPLLQDGRISSVFREAPHTDTIYKPHKPGLPNDKMDINDVNFSPVRLSMAGANTAWPEGDAAARAAIFAEHVRHNVGMLYFLQNDAAVPAKARDEARKWGFCRDEFADNGHLPWQLYVREARRMVGQYVFTERDTGQSPGDARAVARPDAIAMGEYSHNCHGTGRQGPLFGGKHTGEFFKKVAPYQIPYGVLVPKEADNLLVPVACSASHIGFSALRLEPIWTSLGQAAGLAAHLAITRRVPVQRVDAAEVQRRLHAAGAATIFVSDVPPDSSLFAAVQWLGTKGGLHGLAAQQTMYGERGEKIIGQYYLTYPGHAFDPDRPIDEPLLKRWIGLLPSKARRRALQDPQLKAQPPLTRGQALARLYGAVGGK